MQPVCYIDFLQTRTRLTKYKLTGHIFEKEKLTNKYLKDQDVIEEKDIEARTKIYNRRTILNTWELTKRKMGKMKRKSVPRQKTKLFYALNNTLIKKKEISTKIKLTVFKTIYRQTLIFGSER